MWKNDQRRKTIINIILVILIVASVCGLGYFVNLVRAENSAYDAVLAEKHTEQQQEQQETRQEALALLQEAYEQDVATVAEYMPGIVCWGDQLTAGSFGNVSYPDILQKYIDAYICDVYDFSSTIDSAESYTRVDWSTYTIEIPVVNMGTGEETSATVAGRCGASPFVLSKKLVIPATTEATRIYLVGCDGNTPILLTGGDAGVNNVTIQGVEGKLSLVSGKYYFERITPGEEVTAAAGTEIITAATEMYKDYIHIIWVGTYGGYDSPEDLVEQVQAIVSRQTRNSGRFLVIGPCASSGKWDSHLDELDEVDAAMLLAFGSNYINLRKYLCSDGLTDAKLSMTATDKKDIAKGAVPTTFRSASGSLEFSATAYKLLGKLVYERMDKLGFFQEISDELNIAQTTKALLKENANYFANIVP